VCRLLQPQHGVAEFVALLASSLVIQQYPVALHGKQYVEQGHFNVAVYEAQLGIGLYLRETGPEQFAG